MRTRDADERMVTVVSDIGMRCRSSYALHGTPSVSPEDAANGCYVFSPSPETPSSRASVMDCVNEFDYHAASNGYSASMQPSPHSASRMADTRGTAEASYIGAARPRLPTRGAQHRSVTASTDHSTRAAHSVDTHGLMDGVVTSSTASQSSRFDGVPSSRKLDNITPYCLQGSYLLLAQASDIPVDHPAVVAGEGTCEYPSEGARALSSTANITGIDTFPAAAVTPPSPSCPPACPANARQPLSSSTSSTTALGQARNSDVAALRSHLNALLLQQASFPTMGAASHRDVIAHNVKDTGNSSGDTPYSPPPHHPGSDSRRRYNEALPDRPSMRAAHFQERVSHDHGQLSTEMLSPTSRRSVSSLVTPHFSTEVTPSLGRTRELFPRGVTEHQQLPQPPLLCASGSLQNSASNRHSHSSRLSQSVRQARAQQAFETEANDLAQQLEEQLGIVFALMRQIMILDARLAPGSIDNANAAMSNSITDTEDYRESLVRQLEESEEAVVSTSLRFVEQANRHALEWINQGQYSAALQLLQRADGLLRKDAGRLFRYLPDPVELDAPTANNAVGGCAALFDNQSMVPAQQAAAAWAYANTPNLKGGPATLTSSDGGASIRPSSNRSDTNVRSMCIPFFSPSQEPRRLKATAAVEHNFGVYHFKLGEYTLAGVRFARSAAVEEELKAPGIGITYFNMAQTQHRLQQLAEALQYAEMAAEAAERQVFVARVEATQMRRRLAQGCAFQVADLPNDAHAVGSGGRAESEDAAAANASPVSRRDGNTAGTPKTVEEKALVPLWLRWRESVCFMSYVKQTHADWLDEAGLYKEAYKYYRQAHDWLITITPLAPAEVQRVQLLKQSMATMKKRVRREEVEAELYHHPVRRPSFPSGGAGSAHSLPSKGGGARASSTNHARLHQRHQRLTEALSASVPIAKGLTSPLQSTVVTSVLPHAVEVAYGRPRGPPVPHGTPCLQPPAAHPVPRPLATKHTRRRPSSASAALYSVYAPRRTSAPSLPHRHGAAGHIDVAAEQNETQGTHTQPVQKEPPRRQQKHGSERPSSGLSTRVPIPPPDRRARRRTTTESQGSASLDPSRSCLLRSLSHNHAEGSLMHTTTHSPPWATPAPSTAHQRLASQHHHAPPHEPAISTRTTAESSVGCRLAFEVEAESPEPLDDRYSESGVIDALGVGNMEKLATEVPAPASGFAATPEGGKVPAGVSNLAGSASSSLRPPFGHTTFTSRVPSDLTWCVTVLQAFLRSRCVHQTSSDAEVKGSFGEHAAGGQGGVAQSRQRPRLTSAGTAKSDSPSYAADMNRTAAAVSGVHTLRGVHQQYSLSPKSTSVEVALKAELDSSKPSSTGYCGDAELDALGRVSGRGGVGGPSLPASTSPSSAVALSVYVECRDSYAGSGSVPAGEGRRVADARHGGDNDCGALAPAAPKPSSTPVREDASGSGHGKPRSLGGKHNEGTAMAVIGKRSTSPITYESDDNDDGARRASTPEEPLESKNLVRVRHESGRASGDCTDVNVSMCAGENVATREDYAATAVPTRPYPIYHEEQGRGTKYLRNSSADDGVVCELRPPGPAGCHLAPLPVNALVAREDVSCSGDSTTLVLTGSSRDVREEGTMDTPNTLLESHADGDQDDVMTSLKVTAHKEAHHNTYKPEVSGTAAQTVASPPPGPPVAELPREEPEEPALGGVGMCDSVSVYQSKIHEVSNSALTPADATETVASAEEDSGNALKSPSQGTTSLTAHSSRRAPSLLPRVSEEKEDVDAVSDLGPLSHSEASQAPQGVAQSVDQLDNSGSAGLGQAGGTGACMCPEAASIGIPDRSRNRDVSGKADLGEPTYRALLPPPPVSSAGTENPCPPTVEDAALPRRTSTRASTFVACLRSTSGAPREEKDITGSGVMTAAAFEVDGGNGRAGEIRREKIREEVHGAGNDAPHTRSEAPVFNERRASPEKNRDPTGAHGAAVIPQRAEAQGRQITSLGEDDPPHQQCQAAVLFSPSPAWGCRESSRGDSPAMTTALSEPHADDSGSPWAGGSKNAKVATEERSAEAEETMRSRIPGEETKITAQPLATLPPRRGRTFVFVPHKALTSSLMGLTKASRPVHNDVACKEIQPTTLTTQPPASGLDTEGVEDGAAKSLLRLPGGSRTSGSLDAPLSFKEEYYYPAAIQPYLTTDDETLGRHTMSTGSTATPLMQIRESFWKSAHDRIEPRLIEGGESTVKSAQQRIVKLEASELIKVTAPGTTRSPSAAIVPQQPPRDSACVGVSGSDRALARATEDLSDAEGEKVKRLQKAQKELLSTYGINIVEDRDAPSQRTTSAPRPLEAAPDLFLLPCSSPIAGAPTAAAKAMEPADAPRERAVVSKREMEPSPPGASLVTLVPESAAAPAEVSETTVGALSQRNSTLGGGSDARFVGGVKPDAEKTTPPGEEEALAVMEGERVVEDDTIPKAGEVKGKEGVRTNARFSSFAAVSPFEHSASPPVPSLTLASPYEACLKQERLGFPAQSSCALRSVIQTLRCSGKKSTWSDLDVEEAQRRYIRDQIVQEEAATVIQQAWRACVARRQRHFGRAQVNLSSGVMLSVDYGFDTTVKRSGHAACWCAALGGVVQFGGWPPTKHLGNVVRREISSCPLYVLPVTTIARHVHRADQRRRIDAFDAALGSHRQRRLRRLCEIASGLVRCGDEGTSCGHQRKGSLRLGGGVVGEDEGGGVVEERSTSSLSETGSLSITTEEASENSFEYDEGYVSEQEEENADNQSRGSADDASLFSSSSLRSIARYDTGAPQPPLLHTPAGAPDEAVTLAVGDVVVTPITVDALRQMSLETATRIECDASAFPSIVASQDHTSASRSVRTGHVLSTLHNFAKGHGVGYAMDREAPSVQCDTREVRGKHTVRPLRWIKIRPPVAPRSRHGHHLVSCGERLYVIGGSYWAHGNALASSDMLYDVRKRTWQQISSLFPPRFCAALAESNATCAAPCTLRVSPLSAYVVDGATKDAGFTTPSVSASQECRVLYYFGGSNYSHQPTNTLHRLWLPQEELEELPQYGAVPRKQFKGTLVCDVQRECFPDERKRGENSIGRLFYMDGFQDGCPMAPYLRVYDLATGVWVRVCPSPDLVRGQVSLLQFDLVDAQNSSSASREGASVNPPVTRLRRFEVMGGMPARRGKQRRSRMCYSFDAAQQRFDYSHALPVPGLTAHSVVLLPPPDVPTAAPALDSPVAGEEDQRVLADGTTLLSAYQAALTVLREGCGVWSLCCGGNEDWRDAEQNSLGYPVGWLYLFSPRQIPLTEVSRVQMQRLRIQPRVLSKESDELLDELF